MRALSRNTRRATAVTLAAALVIAVYLNWQYARSDVPTELPDNAAMVAAEAARYRRRRFWMSCPQRPKRCPAPTKTMVKRSL